MNKQHREGIGKMPPAPKVSGAPIKANVPSTSAFPPAVGAVNLRDHDGCYAKGTSKKSY